MTVHVHHSVTEIAIGTGSIRKDTPAAVEPPGPDATKKDRKFAKKAAKALARAGGVTRAPALDTDRTWAFDGPGALEDRIIRGVELTANHPGGVPLTIDEEHLRADLQADSEVEAARMGKALAQMAKEGARMRREDESREPVMAGAVPAKPARQRRAKA